MESNELKIMLEQEESPILEFKRDWYWDSHTLPSEKGKQWGELIKDIISLANGYIGYAGCDRYLVVGYSEEGRETYSVDQSNELKDLRLFVKDLRKKMEEYTAPALINFTASFVEIDDDQVLVFKIPCQSTIIELYKELQTKTRTLDSGAVLIRKGQKSDSVRVASPVEINSLKSEIEKKYNLDKHTENKIASNKKERSIRSTVELYISKNTSFYLDGKSPIKVTDWDKNVIFEYYRLVDDFETSRCFLYIHEHASQGGTFGYIKSNGILNDKETLIILTERPDDVNSQARKDNIKKYFKSAKIYFIDEFGCEFLYKGYYNGYEKYNLPVYVESLIEEDENLSLKTSSAMHELKDWYFSLAQPLMVIKGYGGIGKTTLVKHFLDNISDKNKNTGILFIDSTEIINTLIKIATESKKIDDIYDFYTAQIDNQDNNEDECSRFTKDLLRLSVDNGNIIIVLDGIDEVISRLGSKFDFDVFLNSIYNGYSNNLERTKILMTCRDHFWDKLQKNIQIREIKLKPFNEKLAREFFSKNFNDNNTKISKAINMANIFTLKSANGSETIYIPYVLDIVVYLIEKKSNSNTDDISADLDSTKLDLKVSSDFLVANVCKREIKKLGNMSIDSQVEFMIDVAVKYNGCIHIYDVKKLLERYVSVCSNELIEVLKGHTLLLFSEENNSLYFRYDFFSEYFKSLYVSNFFLDKSISDFDFLFSILSSYVSYRSIFVENVTERLKYSDDLLLFSLDLINLVRNNFLEDNDIPIRDIDYYNKVISSIFTLLIVILKRSEDLHFDLEMCSKLIDDLFYRKDGSAIFGMKIIDFYHIDKDKFIVDFRGKVFKNCTFDNYENFWDCHIDINTKFINCDFKSVEARAGINPIYYKDTFINCKFDDLMREAINNNNNRLVNKTEKIKEDLVRFFKLFQQRGNFYPQKTGRIKSKIFSSNILDVLMENGIVVKYIDKNKPTFEQLKVSEKYRQITKYLDQGGANLEFEEVVRLFVNN